MNLISLTYILLPTALTRSQWTLPRLIILKVHGAYTILFLLKLTIIIYNNIMAEIL